MWCSGLGSNDRSNSNNNVDIRACVWGSEKLYVSSYHGDAAWDDDDNFAQDSKDSHVAVYANIAALRHTRLVHGVYTVISYGNKQHIAKMIAAKISYIQNEKKMNHEVKEPTIVLSPMLGFNLNVPLNEANKFETSLLHVQIRRAFPKEIGLQDEIGAGLRKTIEVPSIAKKAVIAPLFISTISCRDHKLLKQPDGLVNAVRDFFAFPRLLQKGDIFSVCLTEKYPVIAKSCPYKAFESVSLPTSYIHEASLNDKIQFICPPVFDLDTNVMFFRVEELENTTQETFQGLLVSEETELLQSSPISARAPGEDIVKRFVSFFNGSKHLASIDSMYSDSKAARQLEEMLLPSQLCNLVVSVLISGPRGVGKTTLVYQVAKHLGVFVVEVAFTELTAQSELHLLENMKDQVVKAQAVSPCILYISHLFAVEKNNEESELRISAALMECMQVLGSRGIPLIACVEDVNEIPKFLRQCFLYELPIEAPNQASRKAFLEQSTIATRLDSQVDLAEIAQLTAGRTYGELSSLIADASVCTLERMKKQIKTEDLTKHLQCFLAGDDDEQLAPSINQSDLLYAIKHQHTQSSAKIGNASIPNVKWEDVGGLEDVKKEIMDVVQLPIKYPELFANGLRQRSGILLYGPPGTGKTLLAKAIATECNLNFLSVKGPELLNMYIGESEKNVREVFHKARSCRPCILFFDELDSLAPMRGRGSDSGGVMDRVVSQLLTEIDGLQSQNGNDQVFVIGATNRPDLLETGLLRPGRFDRLLYLGICNKKNAQLKVIQALTRKFTLANDVDLDQIVAQCAMNFTGADFYALCSTALSFAFKDRVAEIDALVEKINAEDCYSSRPMTPRMYLNSLKPEQLKVPVYQVHFLQAVAQIVPSVSTSELAHYEKLRDQYSSRATC